jgi:hypothetical protein
MARKTEDYSPRLQDVLKAERALSALQEGTEDLAAKLRAAGAENLVQDQNFVPGFGKRFLSDESLRLLKELESLFRIEALDVVLLCLDFVPRKVAQTETFGSAAEAREQGKWLRTTARKLRRTLKAAYVPFELSVRQGKIRMVPRGFPALLIDSWHPLFGPITTRTLWEVAGTDENPGLLQECAAILDHHAPLFDRPRSRPPNFRGMLFAREWENLARRKARRPLDAYGSRLYWVVFGKQVDPDTFKRLRLRVRSAKWTQRIRSQQAGQKSE